MKCKKCNNILQLETEKVVALCAKHIVEEAAKYLDFDDLSHFLKNFYYTPN